MGGIGNLRGAVLGGVLIGLIQGSTTGCPTARPAVVADRRVHDPDPAHGLQARGHARQDRRSRRCETWLLSTPRGRRRRPRPARRVGLDQTRAAGRPWSACGCAVARRGLCSRCLLPHRWSPCDRRAQWMPLCSRQRGPGLGDLRGRPQHRRRLRRSARPRLRRVLGASAATRPAGSLGLRSSSQLHVLSPACARPTSRASTSTSCWCSIARRGRRRCGHHHRRCRRCGSRRLPRAGDPRRSARSSRRCSSTARRQHQPRRRASVTAGALGSRHRSLLTIARHRPVRRSQRQTLVLRRSSCSCCVPVFVSLRIREGGSAGPGWPSARTSWPPSMMGVPLMRTKLRRTPRAPSLGGHRRRLLRRPQQRCPRPVQLRDLDHPARDGRPRRHGQRVGRHDRRAGARLVQLHRTAAVRRLVQRASSAPTSTSRRTTSCSSGDPARAHDAVPAGGSVPERRRDSSSPGGIAARARSRAQLGRRRARRRRRGERDRRRTQDAPVARSSSAEHITKRFGGLVAVERRLVHIPERAIVSLIGPNGAGKTTFFNVLTGLYRPTRADRARGPRHHRQSPHKIAQLGMGRTFQNIRLFGAMTAAENVMVAEHSQSDDVERLDRARRPGSARGARGHETARASCSTSWASASAVRRVRPQPVLRRPAPPRDRPRAGRRARRCCCSTSRPPA